MFTPLLRFYNKYIFFGWTLLKQGSSTQRSTSRILHCLTNVSTCRKTIFFCWYDTKPQTKSLNYKLFAHLVFQRESAVLIQLSKNCRVICELKRVGCFRSALNNVQVDVHCYLVNNSFYLVFFNIKIELFYKKKNSYPRTMYCQC